MAALLDLHPEDPSSVMARKCNRNFKALATDVASAAKSTKLQAQGTASADMEAFEKRMEAKLEAAIDGINESLADAMASVSEDLDEVKAELKALEKRVAALEAAGEVTA